MMTSVDYQQHEQSNVDRNSRNAVILSKMSDVKRSSFTPVLLFTDNRQISVVLQMWRETWSRAITPRWHLIVSATSAEHNSL